MDKTIYVCKTVGKKKSAVAIFDDGIPDFLRQAVKVDIEKKVVHLRTLEGTETIQFEKDDKLKIQGIQYKNFVVAYEEVGEKVAKEKNIPVASDGKYYNVWWKKNADETLIKQGADFFEKPQPIEAQLCTETMPKFLGNTADMLKQIQDGWLFKVSWQDEPLKAQNYQGFWVKYGERDFNFLNVNTPSAQEYNVIDINGNVECKLVEYYQELIQKLQSVNINNDELTSNRSLAIVEEDEEMEI